MFLRKTSLQPRQEIFTHDDTLAVMISPKLSYVGGSKIFRTDAVKTIKLTIRPIGRRHPRTSSVPHVDTGPTVSIFGTHPGSSFL